MRIAGWRSRVMIQRYASSSAAWRAWRERVGAMHAGGFYQLRRACASLLRAAGADPKVISEIMGHTDTRLTEQVHTDVWADQKRDALLRFGRFAGLGK